MCEEENRPVDQDTKALRDRISQNLDKMEKTSDERLIGEHGIKHLYGDVTRNDETKINGEPMSARGELNKLIMGVHHDDGYTDIRIHQTVRMIKTMLNIAERSLKRRNKKMVKPMPSSMLIILAKMENRR